ncbi:MAG: hypothetical protein AVDCRST_MAG11-1885, partial [uncultured Gemmatimonadaceae bacterium]
AGARPGTAGRRGAGAARGHGRHGVLADAARGRVPRDPARDDPAQGRLPPEPPRPAHHRPHRLPPRVDVRRARPARERPAHHHRQPDPRADVLRAGRRARPHGRARAGVPRGVRDVGRHRAARQRGLRGRPRARARGNRGVARVQLVHDRLHAQRPRPRLAAVPRSAGHAVEDDGRVQRDARRPREPHGGRRPPRGGRREGPAPPARVLEQLDRAAQRRGLLPQHGRHAGEERRLAHRPPRVRPRAGDAVVPGVGVPRRARGPHRRRRTQRGRVPGAGGARPDAGGRPRGRRPRSPHHARERVCLHRVPPGGRAV